MSDSKEYAIGDRIEGLYSAIVEYYKSDGKGNPAVGNYDRWFPGQISAVHLGDKVTGNDSLLKNSIIIQWERSHLIATFLNRMYYFGLLVYILGRKGIRYCIRRW